RPVRTSSGRHVGPADTSARPTEEMDSPVIRDSLRTPLRTVGLGAVAAMAVSLAVPVSAGAQSLDPLGRPTEPVLQAMENPVEQHGIGAEETGGGAATAIPGSAELPVPAVPHGQLGFVLTALGTEGVAEHQAQPMTVEWLNSNNGRRGSTPLTYNGINEEGPATVNGVADTRPGQVLMLLQGGVTTNLENEGTADCVAVPTVGTAFVQ